MDENSDILSKEDLQQVVERADGSIAQLMGQQNTALALLSGTTAMSLTANAGILNNVLGALMLQSGVMDSQLGQQQLYDATALEGASAMYLLLSTLSGNVAGMLEQLMTLGSHGGSISGDVAKIAPLIDQMANSGGGANDAANTAFGAIGALAGLGDAKTNVQNIGKAFKGMSGVAGLVGKVATFGPLLASAAPFLVGGLAVAGIGTIAYKAYKNHKAKKEAQETDNTITERSIMDPVALENMENMPSGTPSLPAREPITERSIMDPIASGNMDDMFNNRQASQMDGRQLTADTLREAVKTGNTDVAAQLGAVADALQRLAEKPADRNVKSEIVINTLKTNTTLSEFKEMFIETLVRDLETVE